MSGSKRFGAYLRAIREARRLTLDDVERMTLHESEPVSRSLLSRLENGKARISALKLLALSRLFRVRLALLAERLEIDQEAEKLEQERIADWPIEKLLAKAAEAGRAGLVHRAVLLYEHAEIRGLEGRVERRLGARARLGVARALYGAGKLRLAREVLEESFAEGLEHDDRCWSLYLMGKIALDLDLPFIARAASDALESEARPWPEEIAACAPVFAAEFLLRAGEWDAAFEAWLGALDAARRGAQPAAEARAMVKISEVERHRDRLQAAADWVAKARDLAETHGLNQVKVYALIEEGRVLLAQRRADLARRTWASARRIARSLDLHQELFVLYAELWRLADSDGDTSEARASLRTLRHLLRFLDAVPHGFDDVRAKIDDTIDESAAPAAGEARA